MKSVKNIVDCQPQYINMGGHPTFSVSSKNSYHKIVAEIYTGVNTFPYIIFREIY